MVSEVTVNVLTSLPSCQDSKETHPCDVNKSKVYSFYHELSAISLSSSTSHSLPLWASRIIRNFTLQQLFRTKISNLRKICHISEKGVLWHHMSKWPIRSLFCFWLSIHRHRWNWWDRSAFRRGNFRFLSYSRFWCFPLINIAVFANVGPSDIFCTYVCCFTNGRKFIGIYYI